MSNVTIQGRLSSDRKKVQEVYVNESGELVVGTLALTALTTAELTTLAAGYVTAGTAAAHEGDEYIDTDLDYKVKFDGVSAFVPSLKTTNGALHVSPKYGTSQSTKNRNINAAVTTYAAATNSATWTSTDNVTVIIVTPKSATAAALQNDEFCLVVFDATSEAVANAWLADAGGVALDVEYHIVPVGKPTRFPFTSYLSRVDVLPLNDTMRVIVEAQ